MISLVETFLKARYGRYANTAENRRLHRVGQEYGHRAIDTDDDEEYLASVEGLTKTEQRLQRLEKYRNKYNELVLKTRELAAKNDPKRFVYQEAAEKLYDRIQKLNKRIGAKVLAKEAEKGRKSQNQTDCDNAWGTGTPMEFEKANGKRCNPFYTLGEKYRSNCQSCVVAYELRRRGYNVEARPYTTDAQKYLATWNRGAFLTPNNSYAEPTYYSSPFKGNVADWFEKVTSEKGRYVYSFSWRHSRRARTWYGHIINAERLEDGSVRMYDPQNGRSWDSFNDFLAYIDRNGGFGANKKSGVLRIDDKAINVNFVKNVVKGATSETVVEAKVEQKKVAETSKTSKRVSDRQFFYKVLQSDKLKWLLNAGNGGFVFRSGVTLTMGEKTGFGFPLERVVYKIGLGWMDKASGNYHTGRVYVDGSGSVYAMAENSSSDKPNGVPFTKLTDAIHKLW